MPNDPPAPRRAVAAIVHFGDPALTWRAIASLRTASKGDAIERVLLVENDPAWPAADACPASIARDTLPRVQVIGPPRNRGYGGALNECLARLDPAAAPWFLIVNNDAVLEPGSLDVLFDAAAANPGAPLLAPLITSPVERGAANGDDRRDDETVALVWAAGGVWQPRRARAFNASHAVPLRDYRASAPPAGPIPQSFVSGCILLARTATLQAVGGFDAAFFLYYEDVDLCLRLAGAGEARAGAAATARPASAPLFVPAAVARHDVSQGLRCSPRQTYFNWRNRWWVARRHLRGGDRLAAMSYLAAMTFLHPLLRRPKPWLGHVAAQARGAFEGAFGRLPARPTPIAPPAPSLPSPDPLVARSDTPPRDRNES
jgi:N-acetylglucosaminyl-diphospho-decaprenol L-rhamnosyltransferase